MVNKRANILMENIVFIILNVAFFSILILFLVKQGSGAVLTEEIYAKQIALLIDSAKPETEIKLYVESLTELAGKNNVPLAETVKIVNNQVIVKLSKKGGYSYSFFNKVDISDNDLIFTDGGRYLNIKIK